MCLFCLPGWVYLGIYASLCTLGGYPSWYMPPYVPLVGSLPAVHAVYMLRTDPVHTDGLLGFTLLVSGPQGEGKGSQDLREVTKRGETGRMSGLPPV